MELEGFEAALLRSGVWQVVAQRLIVPWATRAGPMPAAGDVLEVGAGVGFDAETLLEAYPLWRLVVTDYDSAMVARAADRLARFGRRARVEQADATSLAYPDGSFDMVVCLGVLHHLGAWERGLGEMARVLRPGGRLLLADFLGGVYVGPLARLFPPARAYGLGELEAALHQAGFGTEGLRTVGRAGYRVLAPRVRGETAPMAEPTATRTAAARG